MLGACVAVLYLTGTLIVNLDLAAVGVGEFSAFRARAIAVGLAFWLLVLPCAWVGYLNGARSLDAMRAAERGLAASLKQSWRLQTISTALMLVAIFASLGFWAFASAMGGALLGAAFVLLAHGVTGAYFFLALHLWWLVAAAGLGVLARCFTSPPEILSADMREQLQFILYLGVATLPVVVLVYYQTSIYPHIPFGLGGGHYPAVDVQLRSDRGSVWDDLNVARRSDGSRALLLLDEGEDTFVIGYVHGSGTRGAVLIPKSLVEIIVAQPRPSAP